MASLSKKILSGRPLRILSILYDKSRSVNIFTVRMKQSELAQELGITRQALNVHLRKLRDRGYIRTGRGFIDLTERGTEALGLSSKLNFLFVKVLPVRRADVYKRVCELPVRRVFRVTGDKMGYHCSRSGSGYTDPLHRHVDWMDHGNDAAANDT